MHRIRLLLSIIFRAFESAIMRIIIEGYYGGLWAYREHIIRSGKQNRDIKDRPLIHYYGYLARFGSWIGINAKFATMPKFPHGIMGIFISDMAVIGKNSVIFQQVTIGSNTLNDSKRRGAPIIGNNVFIGAGAKIVGNVKIGDNCRIGANCVVVKDMPANTTAVAAQTRFITSDTPLVNTFVSAKKFKSSCR